MKDNAILENRNVEEKRPDRVTLFLQTQVPGT
jgi:hypothetical protein